MVKITRLLCCLILILCSSSCASDIIDDIENPCVGRRPEVELICVYNITYPEFWESDKTIRVEALGHYETLFIDGVAQYETRDRTRMIYHFFKHPSGEEVRFYGGISGLTYISAFVYCYEDEVLTIPEYECP